MRRRVLVMSFVLLLLPVACALPASVTISPDSNPEARVLVEPLQWNLNTHTNTLAGSPVTVEVRCGGVLREATVWLSVQAVTEYYILNEDRTQLANGQLYGPYSTDANGKLLIADDSTIHLSPRLDPDAPLQDWNLTFYASVSDPMSPCNEQGQGTMYLRSVSYAYVTYAVPPPFGALASHYIPVFEDATTLSFAFQLQMTCWGDTSELANAGYMQPWIRYNDPSEWDCVMPGNRTVTHIDFDHPCGAPLEDGYSNSPFIFDDLANDAPGYHVVAQIRPNPTIQRAFHAIGQSSSLCMRYQSASKFCPPEVQYPASMTTNQGIWDGVLGIITVPRVAQVDLGDGFPYSRFFQQLIYQPLRPFLIQISCGDNTAGGYVKLEAEYPAGAAGVNVDVDGVLHRVSASEQSPNISTADLALFVADHPEWEAVLANNLYFGHGYNVLANFSANSHVGTYRIYLRAYSFSAACDPSDAVMIAGENLLVPATLTPSRVEVTPDSSVNPINITVNNIIGNDAVGPPFNAGHFTVQVSCPDDTLPTQGRISRIRFMMMQSTANVNETLGHDFYNGVTGGGAYLTELVPSTNIPTSSTGTWSPEDSFDGSNRFYLHSEIGSAFTLRIEGWSDDETSACFNTPGFVDVNFVTFCPCSITWQNGVYPHNFPFGPGLSLIFYDALALPNDLHLAVSCPKDPSPEAQHGTFISYMFRTEPPSGPEGYNYSDWNCFTQSGDEYEHPSYVSPCGDPQGVAYADGLISLGSLSNPLNAVNYVPRSDARSFDPPGLGDWYTLFVAATTSSPFSPFPATTTTLNYIMSVHRPWLDTNPFDTTQPGVYDPVPVGTAFSTFVMNILCASGNHGGYIVFESDQAESGPGGMIQIDGVWYHFWAGHPSPPVLGYEINPNSTDSNRLYGLGMNANAGAVFREGGPIVANDVVGTWTLISTAYAFDNASDACPGPSLSTRHNMENLPAIRELTSFTFGVVPECAAIELGATVLNVAVALDASISDGNVVFSCTGDAACAGSFSPGTDSNPAVVSVATANVGSVKLTATYKRTVTSRALKSVSRTIDIVRARSELRFSPLPGLVTLGSPVSVCLRLTSAATAAFASGQTVHVSIDGGSAVDYVTDGDGFTDVVATPLTAGVHTYQASFGGSDALAECDAVVALNVVTPVLVDLLVVPATDSILYSQNVSFSITASDVTASGDIQFTVGSNSVTAPLSGGAAIAALDVGAMLGGVGLASVLVTYLPSDPLWVAPTPQTFGVTVAPMTVAISAFLNSTQLTAGATYMITDSGNSDLAFVSLTASTSPPSLGDLVISLSEGCNPPTIMSPSTPLHVCEDSYAVSVSLTDPLGRYVATPFTSSLVVLRALKTRTALSVAWSVLPGNSSLFAGSTGVTLKINATAKSLNASRDDTKALITAGMVRYTMSPAAASFPETVLPIGTVVYWTPTFADLGAHVLTVAYQGSFLHAAVSVNSNAPRVRPSTVVALTGFELVPDGGGGLQPAVKCSLSAKYADESISFATGALQMKETYPVAASSPQRSPSAAGAAAFPSADLASTGTGNVWGRHDRQCVFNGTASGELPGAAYNASARVSQYLGRMAQTAAVGFLNTAASSNYSLALTAGTTYTVLSAPSLHINKQWPSLVCVRYCNGGLETTATVDQDSGLLTVLTGDGAAFDLHDGYVQVQLPSWSAAIETQGGRAITVMYAPPPSVSSAQVNGLLGYSLRTSAPVVSPATYAVAGSNVCDKFSPVLTKDAYVC